MSSTISDICLTASPSHRPHGRSSQISSTDRFPDGGTMEQSAQRFDRIASNYGRSEVHQSSPTLTRLHELVQFPSNGAACDVACGAGHLALSFAGRAGVIVGIDPAPAMLEQFRGLAVERGVEVQAVRAFSDSIPLPSGSFNFVGSRLAPHHFPDVQRSVAEMARLAVPGGTVGIIDLEGFDDAAVDAFNHGLEILHDPTHVRSYTSAEWCE